MGIVRPLLLVGNEKLGMSIFQWSIPPIKTCPGRTPACERVCYATTGHFLFAGVQERLAWNYQQALRADFVDRMTDEVFRKGCIVVRRVRPVDRVLERPSDSTARRSGK